MIQEGVILLRIKHLQKRSSRIALVPTAKLVDFVNKNQWVLRLAFFQCLDHSTRKRANICTTMAFDFRDITHSSNTESVVLPVESARDRFADTGLSNTRRANHEENFPFNCSTKLSDRNEFEDSIL